MTSKVLVWSGDLLRDVGGAMAWESGLRSRAARARVRARSGRLRRKGELRRGAARNAAIGRWRSLRAESDRRACDVGRRAAESSILIRGRLLWLPRVHGAGSRQRWRLRALRPGLRQRRQDRERRRLASVPERRNQSDRLALQQRAKRRHGQWAEQTDRRRHPDRLLVGRSSSHACPARVARQSRDTSPSRSKVCLGPSRGRTSPRVFSSSTTTDAAPDETLFTFDDCSLVGLGSPQAFLLLGPRNGHDSTLYCLGASATSSDGTTQLSLSRVGACDELPPAVGDLSIPI